MTQKINAYFFREPNKTDVIGFIVQDGKTKAKVELVSSKHARLTLEDIKQNIKGLADVDECYLFD